MHDPLTASGAVIAKGCIVVDRQFGAYTWINTGGRIQHATFGDYSCCDRYCDARFGATDHPIDVFLEKYEGSVRRYG